MAPTQTSTDGATDAGTETTETTPEATVDTSGGLTRTVTAEVDLEVREAAHLVWSVAVARGDQLATQVESESLEITLDGEAIEVEEVAVNDGGRLHVCRPGEGQLALRYRASVAGGTTPLEVDPLDDVIYRRPSRYAPSDELGPTAWAEFSRHEGKELLDAVTSWVAGQLYYVSGSSRPTDGATQTLLARQGVCRDFAHLVVAMLRARNLPARLVSVYAPGLSPMDFHAVVEVALEGRWYVVDATRLAPRAGMLRIATGRDAADTAFLTTQSGRTRLQRMKVGAVVEGELPREEIDHLVALT